jgi:C1A family cysteine protease
MFGRKAGCLFVLFAVGVAGVSSAEEEHRTGYLEPTAEEQAWMDEHMLNVKRVKLNDVGLERVEKHLKNKGRKGISKKSVKRGGELEGTVGTASVEEAEDDSMMASAEGISEDVPTAEASGDAVVYADEITGDSFPSSVDNSELNYFPPVGSQGSIGSCAQYSSVYYTMTHMTAMARGWNAKTGGDAYHFSPSFTYNLISRGTDTGSAFQWNLLINHGCARESMFPYSNDYKVWPTDGDTWLDAIHYRADSAWSINGLDSTNDSTFSNALDNVRAILNNGYIANYSTKVYSWQWDTLDDNPNTTADNSLSGEHVVYCVNGVDGAHSMTLVGYNDDVWCDVNGNGTVDTGETGAFKICNSWGSGWKNGGFAWVLYDALRPSTDVPYVTDERTQSIFYAGKVQGITARSEYTPRVVARVTMNHRYRNQIEVGFGVVGDSSDEEADNYCLVYDNNGDGDGGPYAFDGTTTAVDGTFYFDVSDVAPAEASSGQYYMDLTDSSSTNVGAIAVSEVAFVDVASGEEVNGSGVPASVDSTTTRFLASWPGEPQVLPYAESFESGWGAWIQSSDDDYNWTRNSGGTPTDAAGPSGASDGTYYLYAEGHHGLGSYKTSAIEASFDFSTVNSAELSFDYHMYGAYIDYLALDVSDGSSWTSNVWTKSGQQHASSDAAWSTATVNLSAYAGNTNVTLRFRTANTEWNAADPAIDNISISGDGASLIASYDHTAGTTNPVVTMSGVTSFSALGGNLSGGVIATTIDQLSAAEDTGLSRSIASDNFDYYFSYIVNPGSDAVVYTSLSLDAYAKDASRRYQLSYTIDGGVEVFITSGPVESGDIDDEGDLDTYDFADFTSSSSVEFRVYWQGSASASSLARVYVDDFILYGGLNEAPVADNQSVFVNENSSVAILLSGSDPDGSNLTYSVVSQPTNGTLSGTAPNLTYTPDARYTGTDRFSFTVRDDGTTSAAATVSIFVGLTSGVIAGYDFDDGTSNATWVATVTADFVTASEYGVGAGLIDLISNNGNCLAEAIDAEGNWFGTANPLSYGGGRDDFGFTDMNNADNLALAIANNDYMTFTVTPDSGVQMDLTRFTFRTFAKTMDNAAERWALFSSVDGFTDGTQITNGQTTVVATYVDNIIDLPAASFQGLTTAVTFRLYIYGGNGSWSAATQFDKVVVTGSVTAEEAEEPVVIASIFGGSLSLSWDGGGTYNVLTNASLLNADGWGVATNGTSPIELEVGRDPELFYKLESK